MSLRIQYSEGNAIIAGVKIIMTESDGTVTVIATDENGQYTLPSTSNTYTLTASFSETGTDPVSLVDAIQILQYGGELRSFTDDQKKAADVNADGEVDVLDAIWILQHLGELRTLDSNLIFLDANTGKPLSETTFNPGDSPDISVIRTGDVDGDFDPSLITDHAPVIVGRTDLGSAENSLDVVTIEASDADGSSLNFSISGGADKDLFSIDASSGKLSFKASPDYENPGDEDKDNQYDLEITVSDGTEEATQAVKVFVTDLNEKISISKKWFNEGVLGSPVGTLSIIEDGFDVSGINYTLSGKDSEFFSISGNELSLQNSHQGEYDSQSTYEVTVTAVNSSNETLSEQIILGVNTAPTNMSLSNDTVPENEYFYNISALNVLDKNPGDTYTVELSGRDAAYFDVTDSGILRIGNAFTDYEYKNVLEVNVKITDQGGLSFNKDFTINVTNLDSATPNAPDLWSWGLITPSDDAEINSLLLSKYNTDKYVTYDIDNDPSTPLVMSYSIIDKDSRFSFAYQARADVQNFVVNGSSEWERMIDQAFDYWSAVSGIQFVKVNETSSIVGDIRIGLTSADIGESGGFSYADTGGYYIDGGSDPRTPYPPFEMSQSQDIWVRAEYDPINQLTGMSFAPMILIHEIGHSLGLEHPFDGDYYATLEKNTSLYTVMAYSGSGQLINNWDLNNDGLYEWISGDGIYASKPSILDIKTIQYIYGMEPTYNEDNTTYKYSGPVYDTIYDTGGIDLLDLTDYVLNSKVDLRGGKISYIGYEEIWLRTPIAVDSSESNTESSKSGFPISIAENTMIENASLGSGHDEIILNNAENIIYAGSGDDFVYDIDQGDKIYGELGMDFFFYDSLNFELIDGGSDNDYLYHDVQRNGYIANLKEFKEFSLNSIEGIYTAELWYGAIELDLASILNFGSENNLDIDDDGDTDYYIYIVGDAGRDKVFVDPQEWTFFKTINIAHTDSESEALYDFYVSKGSQPLDQTFNVTVQSTANGNRFFIDGVETPNLQLTLGATYTFDQSDSSNSNHPFRFSEILNGTHASGENYSADVSASGTPGSSGAFTQITITSSTPSSLYFYCAVHSGMGGEATLTKEVGDFYFACVNGMAVIEKTFDGITIEIDKSIVPENLVNAQVGLISFSNLTQLSPKGSLDFAVSGQDSDLFEVDSSNNLRLASGTIADFETKNSFNLTLDIGYYLGNELIKLGTKNITISVKDGEENSITGKTWQESESENLVGTDKDDFIDYSGGNDFIEGASGNDLLIINHNLTDAFEITTIEGLTAIRVGSSADTVYRYDDVRLANIESVKFNDSYVSLSTDSLSRNIIYGSMGSEGLLGTSADDLIDSAGGSDGINGGSGNDTLVLFAPSTNFQYLSLGGVTKIFGSKTITNQDSYQYFYQNGLIRMNNVENIAFTDKKVQIDSLLAGNNIIWGTADWEILLGTSDDDVIDSAGGADYIDGKEGNDTLLIFTEKGEFTFFGEVVTIHGVTKMVAFWPHLSGYRSVYNDWIHTMINVETVLFSDDSLSLDTTLTKDNQVWGTYETDNLTGTEDDDLIDVAGGSDFVDGKAGEDILLIFYNRDAFEIVSAGGITKLSIGETESGVGYNYRNSMITTVNVEKIAFKDDELEFSTPLAAENLIFGDTTDNDLKGTANPDLFDSAGGDDYIFGDSGSDTLAIFGKKSDFDVVTINGLTKIYGVKEESFDYWDYTIRMSSVESIAFTDQTASIDTSISGNWLSWGSENGTDIEGTDEDDYLDSGGGEDYIYGGSGDDTLALFGNSVDFEVITLGGLTKIYGLREEGLGWAYWDDTIRMSGVENIEFADKTISIDTSNNGKNWIAWGSSAGTIINGTEGDDLIDSGGGNDFVDGKGGNDTLLLFANRSTFDVEVGIDKVTLTGNEENGLAWWYWLETITITNIETIMFADETVNVSQLISTSLPISSGFSIDLAQEGLVDSNNEGIIFPEIGSDYANNLDKSIDHDQEIIIEIRDSLKYPEHEEKELFLDKHEIDEGNYANIPLERYLIEEYDRLEELLIVHEAI